MSILLVVVVHFYVYVFYVAMLIMYFHSPVLFRVFAFLYYVFHVVVET